MHARLARMPAWAIDVHRHFLHRACFLKFVVMKPVSCPHNRHQAGLSEMRGGAIYTLWRDSETAVLDEMAQGGGSWIAASIMKTEINLNVRIR
jgi:hypothetical protein